MNFATERLFVERLDQKHLGELTTLHLDPEVSRYLGGVRSPEQTAAYLEANLTHWADHGFGLWIVRARNGEFAGRAGIRHTVLEETPEVEIAYTIRRELWGQGLATEVSEALIHLWRSELATPSLVGIASVANFASRRVLEKTGFAHEREAIYQGEPVALYRLMR
ncbi:MAG TPA: GNAT family N-acetyltransferase [Caulobacteraceae bacterium]|jgi:RimJ/RimL family protein N-acetyltransferase|nr:GNAT family N-acetyltransferase [Caulobacteraceae bacterium]